VSAPALVDRVRRRLASTEVNDLAAAAADESPLLMDATALAELSGELDAQLHGAGPLEQLLAQDGVTDVLVNGPEQVWLDRGRGLERCSVRFFSDAEIRALAVRLAAQAGRRLDDGSPYVDASLPDGTRLHAILPPLVRHPTISLRVLARRRLGLEQLVQLQAMSAAVAELLQAVVRARASILISGGTGSGKTTLLAALLATASPGDRIITVEDAAELAVDHQHVVALLARTANSEGAGTVGLRELVRQALRMRADRLVVGEFRGAEVVELLTALNTGHSGGAATVHANSAADVPARLVALAAMGGMTADTLAAQAASALDTLVHIRRDRSGIRRVDEVALWPSVGAHAAPSVVWSRGGGYGPAASELARRLLEAEVDMPPELAGAVARARAR
jgi:pilus assembly protein CpaF